MKPDSPPADRLDELVDHDLPDLLAFLKNSVPALLARPFLAGVLTAAVEIGVTTVHDWRERVRAEPLVPWALGHRPTRGELGAYVRRRPELEALRPELEAAERARGARARAAWDALRRRVGEAQADLAQPLAGRRGAARRVNGLLKSLALAGTVDLPRDEKRALLEAFRARIEDTG